MVLDGRAMVVEALRLRPDGIVVDVSMPLLNGLDAARRIKVQAPIIKFIFLTMRDDPNLAAAALILGTCWFTSLVHHKSAVHFVHFHRLSFEANPSYHTNKIRSSDPCRRKYNPPTQHPADTSLLP